MPQFTLYIDTTSNQLLYALNSARIVDPATLPLFYPDTLQLQVYLMVRLQTIDPSVFQYAIISTAGLSLLMEVTNGRADNDGARVVYTSQYVWNTDAANQYFYANLPLNTASIQALLDASGPSSSSAYLKIAYTTASGQTDVFSRQINIGIGVGTQQLTVAPPLTPLSLEVANNLYYPLAAKVGLPLYVASPNGKILLLAAVDQPDGTATFQASPIN